MTIRWPWGGRGEEGGGGRGCEKRTDAFGEGKKGSPSTRGEIEEEICKCELSELSEKCVCEDQRKRRGACLLGAWGPVVTGDISPCTNIAREGELKSKTRDQQKKARPKAEGLSGGRPGTKAQKEGKKDDYDEIKRRGNGRCAYAGD